MSDLLEGVMLSEYYLLQCISRGGVADVYRGRLNGEGNYEVAVKVYRPGYAQRDSFREYFMTEAEKIGQFEHPNILPLLEFGEGDGLLYSVTPLVTTGTLGDLLRSVGGRLSAMQALPIMQQLCNAVQFAHDRDVIHGNIKPTNIFVATDGRMLLSDFGIVRGYDDSQQSLTRIGWGSAEYAAPEQSLGVLRRASDIYSLGVILFRILTGEPPFTGQTPVEVLLKHVRQQAPSARSIDATISDAVDGVLQIALRKRSDDRFTSAEEFKSTLTEAITVAPVASPVAKAVTPITHQLTHHRVSSDPQTPVPAYIAQSSSISPITPAFPIGQFSPPMIESLIKQPLSAGNRFEEAQNSEITLAHQKNPMQNEKGGSAHMYWSTEPVEWSPIGEETDDSIPVSVTEYFNHKSESPEPSSEESPSTVQPALTEKSINPAETHELRLNKLLPILVVILLLIGLFAALLSSFFLPNSSGSANTDTKRLQIVAHASRVNTNVQATNVNINRSFGVGHD